jgi:hypothetical protein
MQTDRVAVTGTALERGGDGGGDVDDQQVTRSEVLADA